MDYKFTPGPWNCDETTTEDGDWPHVMSDTGLAICDLCDCGSLEVEEQQANARLIAAAPETTEQLRNAIAHIFTLNRALAEVSKAGVTVMIFDKDYDDAEARAIYEKATGEQP